MEIVTRVFKQTFWQGLIKIITASSGFIILAVISRRFGEIGTGEFTLAATFLAFFYIFSDFSFNAHLIGKLQDSGAVIEWRRLLGARLIWACLLVAMAAVILMLLPFKPPAFGFSLNFKLLTLLGLPTIIFYATTVTVHGLFQARLKYQYDIIPTLAGVVLGTGLIVSMAQSNLPIYLLSLGYVVTWFIHSGVALTFVKKILPQLTPIFDLIYLKRLLVETWPMAATLVLNVVYFRVDSFILSFYHSLADVGIYNVAYQVFQSILVLPTYIMNSFYPMMLQSLKVSIDKFSGQIKLAFLALLVISIVLLVATMYLSPTIIKLITGSGFSGSSTSLQLLAWGFPAYFLSSLAMWVMVAKKLYRPMLLVYVTGLLFNVLANLIFIPKHSYLAAAVITGASEYLILILQLTILYRDREFKI